ncbi:LPXTG-motif cell wall-anchored protein [Aurantimicrobium minutum]|uniref:fibronectin type III domain-containing protein n=1 Tax=Aurantimicrobium minutum TaxID=708131 RepID=UPI002473DD8A|nr:fibronectin type III domain-containing protein [Aurantimicrobium minutum]MDH6277125.1 LPXTG-motif cell wall-anchored protein [Aurantimicrobium minutum]
MGAGFFNTVSSRWRLRTVTFVAVILSTFSMIALGNPASSSATTPIETVTVECGLVGGDQVLNVIQGSTIKVHILDCTSMTSWQIPDGPPTWSPDPRFVSPIPAETEYILTLSPSIHYLKYGFDGTAEIPGVSLEIFAHRLAPDPAGEYLQTYESNISTDQSALTVTQSNVASLCGAEIGEHMYRAEPFRVTLDGAYTFRYLGASDLGSPLVDPLQVIYSNFDPSSPESGIVGCNDDRAGEGWSPSMGELYGPAASELSASLVAGNSYTLVTMTHDAVTPEEWDNFQSFNYSWNTNQVDFSTEVWGPTDSRFLYSDAFLVSTDFVTIDCFESSSPELHAPVGAIVEVELLNCDDISAEPDNIGIRWLQEPTHTLLSSGFTRFRLQITEMIRGFPEALFTFYSADGLTESWLEITGHLPVSDPLGRLLSTENFSFPAQDPLMARWNCQDAGPFPVATKVFTTSVAGDYTFRVSDVVTAGSALNDTVIAIYEDYKPGQANSPDVPCNDDIDAPAYSEQNGSMFMSRWSELTAQLEEGVEYTIVVSSYDSINLESWNAESEEAQVDVEMWGPTAAALVPGGTGVTRGSEQTIDCEVPEDQNIYAATNTQFIVHVSNCSDLFILVPSEPGDINLDRIATDTDRVNGDYLVWVDDTLSSSPESSLYFQTSSGEIEFHIEGMGAASDPPGELIGTTVQNFRRYGPPVIQGNCNDSDLTFPYAARRFSVDVSGDYTFRVSGVTGTRTPLRDTVIGIYEEFVPGVGGDLIGCNDDRDETVLDASTGTIFDNLYSEVAVTLDAGNTYVLLTTPYEDMTAQEWDSFQDSNLIWDVNGVNVSTQVWGPVGSTLETYRDYALPPAPTVPVAPTNLTAIVEDSGDVTISWEEPENGGSALTGYAITLAEGNELVDEFNFPNPSFSLGYLDAGEYRITVAAANAVGLSEEVVVEFVIEAAVADVPVWIDSHIKQFQSGRSFQDRVWATALRTVSYAVTAGSLPPGVSLNPVTGNLSGTPSGTDSYSFTITASTDSSDSRRTFSGRVRSSGPYLSGGVAPTLVPGMVSILQDGQADTAVVTVNQQNQGTVSELVISSGNGSELILGGTCVTDNVCEISRLNGRDYLSAEAEGTIGVSGTGLQPGSEIAVYAFSTPRLLSRILVASDGSYSASVPISGLPVGQHTLQTVGIGQTGYDVVNNVGFMVTSSASGGGTPIPSSSESAALAWTGSQSSSTLMWAMILLALGVGISASRRNKRN